jgi:hypothetical protein
MCNATWFKTVSKKEEKEKVRKEGKMCVTCIEGIRLHTLPSVSVASAFL